MRKKSIAIAAIALLLLSTSTLKSSDVEQARSHASEPDPIIAQMFSYLFGTHAPKEVEHVVKRKLGESEQLQDSMRRISESSGSSTDDDSDADLRRMIIEAVHEALEESKLEAIDARLQLEMKDKEVRQERYKFFLGVAGTCTAGLGLIGTIIAYQTTGC